MSMITEIKQNLLRVADLAQAAGVDQTAVDNIRRAVKDERGMAQASEALRVAVAKTNNTELYTQVTKLVLA